MDGCRLSDPCYRVGEDQQIQKAREDHAMQDTLASRTRCTDQCLNSNVMALNKSTNESHRYLMVLVRR